MEEPPRLTLERIGQLRAALNDNFKAMKKAHAEAQSLSNDAEVRGKANKLLVTMRGQLDDAIDEYNLAKIDTLSEERAANELLTEIQVYKDNVGPQGLYQLIPPANLEGTRSRASISGSGSTRSSRSIIITQERDQELEKENTRREQEKAESEVQVAELQRQIAEIQKKDQLDSQLSEMKKKALHKLHDDQQKLIEQEEGVEGEEEEREKLEAAVGGAPLADAEAKERTKEWAEKVEYKDLPMAKTVKGKKKIKKPKYEKTSAELTQAQAKAVQELQVAEKKVEEKRLKARECFEQEKVKKEQKPEAELEGRGSSAMEKLINIQAKMWAISHLQEIRPKDKFSGGKKTDFAKKMKQVEAAFETPCLTAHQKLQELKHYFEGAAYDIVEQDVLREDADAALKDALSKLRRKFGVRRETALDMLEELLVGKPIGEKDHGSMLNFYAKLTSVYSLAKETKRTRDFEARSVVETVLLKKLPHLMSRWTKKAVRHLKAVGEELEFPEFLEFLDEEHAVAERLARMAQRTQGVQNLQRQAQVANVAATSMVETTTQCDNKDSCGMCGATHGLAACAAFRNAATTEKRRVCIVNGICYNCLLPGHGARLCPSVERCQTCSQKHHTLVHAFFAPALNSGAAATTVEVAAASAAAARGGNPA